MSNTWLVIPSNRMDNLARFFDAWKGRGGWDKVVVIEDAPQRSNNIPWVDGEIQYYSHAEIKEVLGEDSWIISRKDSACRCFGFLLAWWGGAERVITLDDDVRPIGTSNLVADHLLAGQHPRWQSSIYGLRVRGLPYQNHGILSDVVVNVGLWTEHMDFDAICQLSLIGKNGKPSYRLPTDNWIIPHGQFAPICGMNLMIERKALPLAYFPLMGEAQPFARFDDIWMGIIMKHCCDALGWHISVGKPFVRHDKASNPFTNLKKEAPGIGANETFWQRIADINLDPRDDALTHVYSVAQSMRCWEEDRNGYWNRLGKAMERWVVAFRNKPVGLKL